MIKSIFTRMKKLTGKLSFNARVNLSNSNLSNRIELTPKDLQKSVGVISLISAYQICLSVGATIGRPRVSGAPFGQKEKELDFSSFSIESIITSLRKDTYKVLQQ